MSYRDRMTGDTPFEFTPEPDDTPHWPDPDYTLPGTVVTVAHDDRIVGFLVLQDNALDWHSVIGPEYPVAYAVRVFVEQLLEERLRTGDTAPNAATAVVQAVGQRRALVNTNLAAFLRELKSRLPQPPASE